jgi:hypothetical protein
LKPGEFFAKLRLAMDTVQVGRRVLAHAAAKIGGVEELGARLKISHRVLQHYLAGGEPVPDVLLLRAIDVILEELPGVPN